MAQWRSRKVRSISGKLHQERKITMARPVSFIIRHILPKTGRSIAHSKENERFFVEKVRIVENPNGMNGNHGNA